MIRTQSMIPFGGPEGQHADPGSAGIVVLPLCYEHASSYGTGSGEGPYHLLAASEQLERVDEETLIDWLALKIHTMDPLIPKGNPAEAIEEMKAAAEKVLAKKAFLLSLGGDHAISLGPIEAVADAYPGIGILQIDAHLDLRDEWNGSRYNHACIMRRVSEDLGLRIVPVGTRSFSPEELEYIGEKGISPFFAHKIAASETAAWIDAVVASLPEHVYITVDLDGLDPAVIPGTGTPEPGGLSYRELVALLEAVGEHRTVVAADINELAKIEGTQVSETAAAKIATKIMVHCTAKTISPRAHTDLH